MRPLLTISAMLLSFAAQAFDSAEWLGKRELLSREAERLQKAYAECDGRLDTPAENVSFPIEGHPDGSIKSVIMAERAQFFIDTGLIWGTNIVVRQMATNGVVEAEIRADNCVFDRSTKSGWVAGHAWARYFNNEVEGDGIYFSFSEEFVTIYANTQIRAKDQKFDTSALTGGAKRGKKGSAARRTAKISARRTDLDRKAGVLLFDGGVHVSDPEYALGAQRVFAFLSGTNSLKRIVADGAVSVTNGLRYGSCARATYSKTSGKVVMYSDEGVSARLVEESHKRDEVEGKRITFWLDSEQIEVEGSTITVDGGMSRGKDGAFKLMGK